MTKKIKSRVFPREKNKQAVMRESTATRRKQSIEKVGGTRVGLRYFSAGLQITSPLMCVQPCVHAALRRRSLVHWRTNSKFCCINSALTLFLSINETAEPAASGRSCFMLQTRSGRGFWCFPGLFRYILTGTSASGPSTNCAALETIDPRDESDTLV